MHFVAISRLIVIGAVVATYSASASACEPGVWDIESSGKTITGQEYRSRGSSTRYCLFDGDVEFDEYRAFSSDGNVVFIGASFHYWTNGHQNLKTLWVMGGDPGYTIITGRLDDNRLTTSGVGEDADGKFLERFIEVHAENRDYTLDMDRSYDQGNTWSNGFSSLRASYRTNEVPSLPENLHSLLQQAKAVLDIQSEGFPVMSGFGEVEEIVESKDGEAVRIIKFSSRYRNPDRWRTVYWPLGNSTISVVETPINAEPGVGPLQDLASK